MKHFIALFFVSFTLFSQLHQVKKIDVNVNEIELNTVGLDEIKILNSKTKSVEVTLLSKEDEAHYVSTEEENKTLKIRFTLNFSENKSKIFRKYITERVNRASAILKIPKDKRVVIYGRTIDVISENYKFDLAIYIDEGYVNLNEVQKDVSINLFQGNVYAKTQSSSFDITTNKGSIKFNQKEKKSPYKEVNRKGTKKLIITSINANVFIKTN